MNTFLKANKIKVVTLLIISVSLVIKLSYEDKPYATGDGIEYSLMTEALFNHLSPDVRPSDCESFKRSFTKVTKWEENDKATAYDATCNFINQDSLKLLEYNYAFFLAENENKYSVHFFFYSLLNVPVRWVCSIIPFNPLRIFYITNILLILISCFLIFRRSSFDEKYTTIFVLLFFFSSTYWYLCWTHPEVFTICFVTVGLWFFFQGKNYAGILLVAFAALQNQPLSLLVAFLFFAALFIKGFGLKNIVKAGLSAMPVFIPALFYYYHFGETNLIQYQGALSFKYVTFTRVAGFFFDLNQGAILAIPLILISYLVLLVRKLILIKTANTRWDLFIPLVIIAMVCAAGTINNWNHGQAVVNRYVTYLSAAIIVHFFYLLMEIKSIRKKNILIAFILLSQLITVFYHQGMSHFDWSTNQPKPISNWVLSHFPKLYNPDPVIFIERYAPGMIENVSESPACFSKKSGEITKCLVHREYINNLEKYGFSKKQIDSISPLLNYITDWAYIDVGGTFQSSLNATELKKLNNEKKIQHQMLIMKKDPAWYETILGKAQKAGVTEEEVLRQDAKYILGIEDVGVAKTKEQRVADKMNQIRANPDWYKLIEAKAKELNVSNDSALYNDALWMVDQEMKKD